MLRSSLCSAAAALALFPLALPAQSPASAASSTTLPLAGVYYRYWPEQIVQWVGPELPYSMIVLSVDDRGKQPIYDCQLIDKSGKESMHYTNSAQELAILERAGMEAHQVAMQFDGPSEPSQGAQYMLRFNTEKGVPVVWQFILGTDVSEQGSGVSPVPAPIPIVMYREEGGLAGQGTALQVGGVTSTADVWKEIAQPPYFVPYRGALSTGVHILTFAPVDVKWKLDGPSLTDSRGRAFSVATSGGSLAMTDAALGYTASYSLDGGSISRVTFAPTGVKGNHTFSLEFSPALAAGSQSSFEVIAGRKTKVASGSVQESPGPSLTDSWSFSSPEAMKGLSAKASEMLQR